MPPESTGVGDPEPISLRHLNRVVEIDVENTVLVCEAGARVADCRQAAAEAGMWCPALRWLPPDTLIGAAIAAGHGRRSLRYGAIADYVLGLRFACPAVGLVRHGGKAIKNATGYNLSGMLVGSRGMLGVILEATLRLLPKPRHRQSTLYQVVDPSQIWNAGREIAVMTAAAAGSSAKLSGIGLAAIEGWTSSPFAQATLLVETESGHDDGPLPEDVAKAIGLTSATAITDSDAWPPSPSSPGARRVRFGLDPSTLPARVEQILAAAKRQSNQGYVLAELTGGAVELGYFDGISVQSEWFNSVDALAKPSPVVLELQMRLKSAFDPRGQLHST